MTDQGGDLEETVHLQDTNHVEDGAARRRVIQQREYVDVEAGRARIVLEYFLGVLDLLTERIEVARAQIDEHIDDVEGESEEIQGGVERVEAGRIDRDTHRNEHYRVDGDKDDQVGPAYTPDVFTWDDVLACSSTFNLLLTFVSSLPALRVPFASPQFLSTFALILPLLAASLFPLIAASDPPQMLK